MNKTELITYLREPNKLSPGQLDELESIVKEHPYFLSARLLLAKASKENNHPETKKRVASAAIYSTDRVLLKKYLSGNLFFLHQPAEVEEPEVEEKKPTEKAKQAVQKPVEAKQAPKASPPEPKGKVAEKKTEASQAKETKEPTPVGKPKEQDIAKEQPKERTDKRPSAVKEQEP